jgi:hypothetical protein
MFTAIGAVPLLFGLLQADPAPDGPVQLDFTLTVETR